jgi:hypothetical protein
MDDTPRTRTEFIASWSDWEGAICVTLVAYERLERELAEERRMHNVTIANLTAVEAELAAAKAEIAALRLELKGYR